MAIQSSRAELRHRNGAPGTGGQDCQAARGGSAQRGEGGLEQGGQWPRYPEVQMQGGFQCRCSFSSRTPCTKMPALWLHWNSVTGRQQSAGAVKGTQGDGSWKMLGKAAAQREMSLSGC